MTATLQLNLADALTKDELQTLLSEADKRKTTVERILYEAAHLFCTQHPAGKPANPR